MIRYRFRRPADEALRTRMRELAAERRRFGYRRLHVLLRQEGLVLNRKRTQRLYREEGLTVRRRRGRKRATGARAPLLFPPLPNSRGSIDFVHDQLACGRRFRILNVDRRRHQGVPRGGCRHLDLGQAGRTRAHCASQPPGETGDDRLRPRNRVHLERHTRLNKRAPHRLALHRARQADAERHLRELQRAHARRAVERDAVLRSRPRQDRPRALGRRLQRMPSPLGSALPDPSRLCG